MKISRVLPFSVSAILLAATLSPRQTLAAPQTRLAQAPLGGVLADDLSPVPTPTAAPIAPPQAQAYLSTDAPARVISGHTFVPVTFFSNGFGASVGAIAPNRWRLLYFGTQIDFFPNQRGYLNGKTSAQFDIAPRVINNRLYVPLRPFAEILKFSWSAAPSSDPKKSRFLVQYPAAFVQNVQSTTSGNRVRTVVTFSNPTRIVAWQSRTEANFQFAGARRAGSSVPNVQRVGDMLVPATYLSSGNWNAQFGVKLNYAAPLGWFTLGNPSRLVIDAQRIFEERSTNGTSDLRLTSIRRGTGHGPVQMWAAKFDPRAGWRIRVEPAGYSVLQRARTSKLAARHKAALAVNGGFFAYDGAAVGAVLQDGEWIRLPWGGRTAVGFDSRGRARIDNLQTHAYVDFSGGLRLPIRDLNGWPDKNRVTALTRRFGTFYQLRPGEIALVVKNGTVIAKPGGGGANVPEGGFTLVANGSARTWLQRVARGERAKMTVRPVGWNNVVTALGGGPRLVRNSKISVADENFRSDVRVGTGPRTAFGIDAQGRYIILVADGRRPYYSTGLTLHELAATMQKLGAVDALNLDGGGSTAMALKGRVVNRPSDGRERGVANALLVMR